MDKEDISWKLIDKYFKDNPNNLVSHHLESYNSFINKGVGQIFRENNPIRFIEREDENDGSGKRNECQLYLGGKDGSKIYYGKPIIYDDNNSHFMFPNDARLRNMTYGVTIHYDVEVEVFNDQGDSDRASVTIFVNSPPTIVLEMPNFVRTNESATLDASESFEWRPGLQYRL